MAKLRNEAGEQGRSKSEGLAEDPREGITVGPGQQGPDKRL